MSDADKFAVMDMAHDLCETNCGKPYCRVYSSKKQLAEKQVEIEGDNGSYKVRLVSYYHEHETERTDWRGNFATYQAAHDFGMWWKKQR